MTPPEARIRRRIEAAGPVPFAWFMEQALYGEEGYYSAARPPIGRGGDYITGSACSPLFGRATGRLLRALGTRLAEPVTLLEVGFGDGRHLEAVAETAPTGTRLVAWDRAERAVPPGVERLDSLDAIADRSLAGVVFSYELFDALPVHRLVRQADGGLGELWVDLDADGAFVWRRGALSRPELAALVADAAAEPAGQIFDVAPGWEPLYTQMARKLRRGLLVTCDYGYERQRLFDPRVRRAGTLACYRRHRVHRDALGSVGRQDLTAHVDFTALRRAGEEAGLTTLAFSRQALWLTACGVFEDLVSASTGERLQAATLLDPEGMGEEIRVLVQGRGVELEPLLAVPRVLDQG